MVDVSIIIVSYNTKDLLLGCLDSVFLTLQQATGAGRMSLDARSLSRGYEVIVVDNASADGSAAAVQQHFPEAHLIDNEFNRGFAAANNQALAVAQGRYLLLLNPDTVVKDGAIPELVRFMDRFPRCGMATCKLLNLDETQQHSAFKFPTLWMTFLDFFPLHGHLLNSRLNGRYRLKDYRRTFEIDHPLGACMMVRREVIERVGALSEEYFMYCEEIDWCFRIKRDNWRIYCVPTAEIYHLGGQSTRQVADRMYVELFRSRLTLFRKYYNPVFQVLSKLLIGAGLWTEYARWLGAYLKGQVSAERLQGRRQALKQIVGMLLSTS
ncbi:MAG: glycosyltransferase family 2 protein [Dehalococcoidia bacterium]|nr:glycosyltransferase family 2 protein [Dehalococcoidia bacterium]